MAVLLKRQDYYELTDAYLARAAAEGVRHAEIFFVPQGHTARHAWLTTAGTGAERVLHVHATVACGRGSGMGQKAGVAYCLAGEGACRAAAASCACCLQAVATL